MHILFLSRDKLGLNLNIKENINDSKIITPPEKKETEPEIIHRLLMINISVY